MINVKTFKASVKELFFYLLTASFCCQSSIALAEQKLHRDNWYLSQPEENATIQMSGHATESDAIAYIEKVKLSGVIGYYNTQYKNMPWYAVTYGNFTSLDEARSHLELLPEELQQHAPWPRTFKAIRSLIDVKGLTGDVTGKPADKSHKQESTITNKAPMELNWEQGQAAYDNGDFTTAFNIWQTLAQQGDELSQFNLGVMYSRGQGTEENGDKALKWYIKSAEQGYAPAQFNLGAVYLGGKFTDEDAVKAATWWKMAAEQGFVQAQFNIASLYCQGIGVSRDQGQCTFWYRRAASNGDTHARKMLDYIIERENAQKPKAAPGKLAESELGKGSEETSETPALDVAQKSLKEVAPDVIQVTADTEMDTTRVAAAEKSLDAEKLNEQMHKKKPEVRQLSSEEHAKLARAQKAFTRGDYKKAHDFWLPLAENGIAEAQYSLGFLYQSGWGSEQDLLQAVAWYSSAAEQNEARAQFNLGVLLINGEDEVDKDTETGVLWLTRSAEGNNTRAKEFLIYAYDKGLYGIEKSKDKAEYWKSR